MDRSPNISSFVIRIIVHEEAAGLPFLRGTVRHVQSDQEINFNRWDEAEAFMQSFVPVPFANHTLDNNTNA
jgi:hypothetical protein